MCFLTFLTHSIILTNAYLKWISPSLLMFVFIWFVQTSSLQLPQSTSLCIAQVNCSKSTVIFVSFRNYINFSTLIFRFIIKNFNTPILVLMSKHHAISVHKSLDKICPIFLLLLKRVKQESRISIQ